MQHRTGTTQPSPRILRSGTAALLVVVSAVLLAGCSRGGHDIGEGVSTKLHGSDFTGQAVLTTTEVEQVTPRAVREFGYTLADDDDAYLAHFTVRVDSGSFPTSAVDDFGNAAWGLRADGKLQAGPELAASDRSAVLQDACPFHPSAFARTLREGGTAKGCALLLAPTGSTVTGVSYLHAAPVDDGPDGDATITWTKDR